MTVIGAGSCGTALHSGEKRPPEVVLAGLTHIATATIAATSRSLRYCLFDTLRTESDLATALAASRNILVVPSHVFSDVLRQIKPLMRPDARLVWATKGTEAETGRLLQDVSLAGVRRSNPAGGDFRSLRAGGGLPTAIAGLGDGPCRRSPAALRKKFSRLYQCGFIGVQLGGAVKKRDCDWRGMSDGIGFGANAARR